MGRGRHSDGGGARQRREQHRDELERDGRAREEQVQREEEERLQREKEEQTQREAQERLQREAEERELRAALAPLATYLIYAAAVALRRTLLRPGPPAR
jgi:hypothetical protein